MTFTLPKLYPIADVESLERHGLSLEQFTRGLVQGGAGIVQLRDKQGTPQQVLDHAAAVSAALTGSGCLPVMNDRADLALLAGWQAVHVGHGDLPPEAVRQVFGTAGSGSLTVGVSTHTGEQVVAADAGGADYIAVGPVFATGTKPDAEPVIGIYGVQRARRLTRKPIVAIGGITRENAVAVLEAGADAVAVIGALLSRNETVEDVVRDFLDRMR